MRIVEHDSRGSMSQWFMSARPAPKSAALKGERPSRNTVKAAIKVMARIWRHTCNLLRATFGSSIVVPGMFLFRDGEEARDESLC
jgi:hypothetical protein